MTRLSRAEGSATVVLHSSSGKSTLMLPERGFNASYYRSPPRGDGTFRLRRDGSKLNVRPSPPEAQSDDRSMQDQVEVVFIGTTILAIVDRQGAIANDSVKVRLPEVEAVAGK